jgi:hypothetical protein
MQLCLSFLRCAEQMNFIWCSSLLSLARERVSREYCLSSVFEVLLTCMSRYSGKYA